MANKFLVSVADAVLRDPNTGAGLAYGKANISSAFTMSMAATEVRGGKNNPLLYVYYHDKKLEIKIEEAIFSKTLLALNSGTSIVNGVVEVVQTDCLVLSSGSATLTATPIGNVSVFLPDGTIQVITAGVSGSITVPGGLNQRVDAVYATNVTADQVTIETIKPPTLVDMTLLAEVRDNTNTVVENLQIRIPRFQVSGNYNLAFTANGVSSQALDGMALAVASSDCVTGEYYAKITWIPASGTVIPVSAIAAVPTTVSMSAAGVPQSRNITVYGIRGGLYANSIITTSCSFVKSGSNTGFITAGSHSGSVTASTGTTASATALVTVSYTDATNGTLTDTVNVTMTA
jgi:hypothetical protein